MYADSAWDPSAALAAFLSETGLQASDLEWRTDQSLQYAVEKYREASGAQASEPESRALFPAFQALCTELTASLLAAGFQVDLRSTTDVVMRNGMVFTVTGKGKLVSIVLWDSGQFDVEATDLFSEQTQGETAYPSSADELRIVMEEVAKRILAPGATE